MKKLLTYAIPKFTILEMFANSTKKTEQGLQKLQREQKQLPGHKSAGRGGFPSKGFLTWASSSCWRSTVAR